MRWFVKVRDNPVLQRVAFGTDLQVCQGLLARTASSAAQASVVMELEPTR